jgi:hypothetical protein
VNGERIQGPTRLATGDRVIIGENHFFRFKNPAEGRTKRHVSGGDLLAYAHPHGRVLPVRPRPVSMALPYARGSRRDGGRSGTPVRVRGDADGPIDWEFAQRELARAQGRPVGSAGAGGDGAADDEARAAMARRMEEQARELERSRQEQRDLEERLRRAEAAAALSPTPLSRVVSPAPASATLQAAARAPAVFVLETPAAAARWALAVRRWRLDHALTLALLAEARALKRANIITAELRRPMAYQFALASKTPFARDASVTFVGDPRLHHDEGTAVAIAAVVRSTISAPRTWELAEA